MTKKTFPIHFVIQQQVDIKHKKFEEFPLFFFIFFFFLFEDVPTSFQVLFLEAENGKGIQKLGGKKCADILQRRYNVKHATDEYVRTIALARTERPDQTMQTPHIKLCRHHSVSNMHSKSIENVDKNTKIIAVLNRWTDP